jgi:NAD(P)-dependent dehydrogenase (short-subunit alcohol dehydrogenase family)
LAVVTGASRGIGREVAMQLSALGYVIVGGARSAESVRAALADAPGEVVPVALDVTSDDQVAQLERLLAADGRDVEVVVNNAGVAIDGWDSTIVDVDLGVLRDTWEVNALGALRVVRAALPSLGTGGDGLPPRIVNVSSGMGQLSQMGGHAPAYRSSKTLLNAFTRILDADLGERAWLASVCPGWVRTDMGGERATRSVEQGADTIVWLAETAADGGPSGRFWRDRAVIEW